MSVKHAILILLEHEAASGYDLSQRFNRGIGQFWQASHQQIYQQLKRLSREGAVTCELIPQQGKPDRKVYHITSDGRQALQQWLASESKIPSIRDALLIKIYAASLGQPSTLQSELERHLKQHRCLLQQHLAQERDYFALPADKQKQRRWPYLTLRRGIAYEREWISWLEEVRELLIQDQAQG